MNGYEAYLVLCEAAGLIDEAGLEEGKKTLGQKLSVYGRDIVALNTMQSGADRMLARLSNSRATYPDIVDYSNKHYYPGQNRALRYRISNYERE